jgi:hypothetical protein
MYLLSCSGIRGGFPVGGRMSVCADWEPVPLAVGHDLAYLLWNSSYKGSEHYLLSFFLLQICLYATCHGCL